jgi:hypothetical protein
MSEGDTLEQPVHTQYNLLNYGGIVSYTAAQDGLLHQIDTHYEFYFAVPLAVLSKGKTKRRACYIRSSCVSPPRRNRAAERYKTLPAGHSLFQTRVDIHIFAQTDNIEHLAKMRSRMHHPYLYTLLLQRQDQIEKHGQTGAINKILGLKNQQNLRHTGRLGKGRLQRFGGIPGQITFQVDGRAAVAAFHTRFYSADGD